MLQAAEDEFSGICSFMHAPWTAYDLFMKSESSCCVSVQVCVCPPFAWVWVRRPDASTRRGAQRSGQVGRAVGFMSEVMNCFLDRWMRGEVHVRKKINIHHWISKNQQNKFLLKRGRRRRRRRKLFFFLMKSESNEATLWLPVIWACFMSNEGGGVSSVGRRGRLRFYSHANLKWLAEFGRASVCRLCG